MLIQEQDSAIAHLTMPLEIESKHQRAGKDTKVETEEESTDSVCQNLSLFLHQWMACALIFICPTVFAAPTPNLRFDTL